MYIPKRMVYIIIALCYLWGFIAFSIGYGKSMGWAMVLGMVFFLFGVGAHMTGLKKPIGHTLVSVNHEKNAWLRNGYQGWQNLN